MKLYVHSFVDKLENYTNWKFDALQQNVCDHKFKDDLDV